MSSNDASSQKPHRAERAISRRRFLQFGGAAALTVALPLGGLSGCKSKQGDEFFYKKRTITDHAGREVEIPTADALERVYFTSGLAEVFVFTMNPDLLAGTASRFSEQELHFLPEGFGDLKSYGSLSGDGEIDREALLDAGVQVVFSISGVALTAANISDAEKLQKQTGIPVVCVDGSFDKIATAYRFLGDCFGLPDRAEELASYLENVYSEVTASMDDLADADKISLYYAEGPLGLQTEPDISQHALTFEIAGAHNVAAVEEGQNLGMSNVSLEQVLEWNPSVIVAWDSAIRGGADELIRTKASWSTIAAVQNQRVYTMPNLPFAWCDRPPGVNRFIGIQWVANMLYPDRYDVDMVEVLQDFYKKMYWVDVSTDDALALLGNSYPALGRTAKYISGGTSTVNTSAGSDSSTLESRQKGGD